MASGKGLLISALGGLVLREGKVSHAREVSPHFRWITLQGEGLREIDFSPGDKVQVLLPTKDVRTYTPLCWDRQSGTTELLLFRNQPHAIDPDAAHPGTRWIAALQPGDVCRFLGPQRSLALEANGKAVLFGDETSFAVARALHQAAPGCIECVFEVGNLAECREVLSALGLSVARCIERRTDGSHLADANDQVQALLTAHSESSLILTGCAQSIQGLVAQRRKAGQVRPKKTKPYWSRGRAGLD